MVIDDGWSVNSCAGPWTPNGKYGDVKRVAEGLHRKGVKAGREDWKKFMRSK